MCARSLFSRLVLLFSLCALRSLSYFCTSFFCVPFAPWCMGRSYLKLRQTKICVSLLSSSLSFMFTFTFMKQARLCSYFFFSPSMVTLGCFPLSTLVSIHLKLSEPNNNGKQFEKMGWLGSGHVEGAVGDHQPSSFIVYLQFDMLERTFLS